MMARKSLLPFGVRKAGNFLPAVVRSKTSVPAEQALRGKKTGLFEEDKSFRSKEAAV